jgi:hypothetical protein
LADALLVLEGTAQDQNPDQVHLRVAKANGAVWLDLGDAAETAVRINQNGWDVVRSGVPVLFRRTGLTGVMPEPKPAGEKNDENDVKYGQSQEDSDPFALLWRHLNVAPADRPLVLAWLIAAIIDPEIAHAILAVFGEQGTGKSTASKRIVALVDPSPAPLRKPPRDPESWVTAAQGSWVVGLDNLSHVPDWLCDSLCRAATGDGDVRRALYTDAGLAVFAFRRCVLLNGIDVGALRGDLADRLLKINLDRIEEDARAEETELDRQWAADYPIILGNLLTLAGDTIARLPSVRLAKKPRMADFALILAAIDQLRGTDGLTRFAEQARTMAEDSLSSEPFIAAMDEAQVEFEGTAAELLTKVTPDLDRWRSPKGWPKDPRAVTSLLKRNAPALRKAGWVVEDEEGAHRFTIWTVIHPEKVRISHHSHRSSHQSAETAETAESKYGPSLDDEALNGEDRGPSRTGEESQPTTPTDISGKGPPSSGRSASSATNATNGYETCPGCGAKFLAVGQDICKVCAARKLREMRDQAP